MTIQFARNSFFNQITDKQRRNKSSLYYGIKRGAGVAKYSGLLATTCLVGLAVTQNKAMAAPTGGNVVGGNADITVSGSQTNINQSSNRAAIDWQSFSVAADESVNFTVPNGGATLNRVIGSQASLIQGRVQSNGSLYLVNPNGLVLDAGSQISAQNFIATTSNIDPAQFMTGDHVTLQKSSTNARISLKGTITVADRGVVGIFAPKVENQGTIIANLGSVLLAGSQASVIDFNGDGLINFELGATDGRTGESLLASNKGVINAAGGHVTLTAQGAESLFNAVVENSGTINATSLSAKGGTVTLKANLGSVKDSGAIEASGATGGGEVLVWASENADFTGDIKAEALANNTKSNGGAVEVSGLKHLNFNGTVSTLSHNGGKTGSLLLDPTDIEILDTVPSGNTSLVVASNKFSQTGSASTSYISTANLVAALASNNVTVDATTGSSATATGKITVSNQIEWGGTGDLTLKAGAGGIAINAKITSINATKRNLVLETTGGRIEGAYAITANDVTIRTTGGGDTGYATLGNLALSGTVSGTVAGGANLTGAFTLGAFSITSGTAGFYIYNSQNMTVVAPTRAAGVRGEVYFKVTKSRGTLTLANDITLTNTVKFTLWSEGALTIDKNITADQNVILSSYSTIKTASGAKITASNLAVNADSDVNIATSIATLVTTNATLGNFTIVNDGSLALNSNLIETNKTISLTSTLGSITAGGLIAGKSLYLSAATGVNLTNINITDTVTTPGTTIYGAITGSVAGEITLGGAFGSISGLTQTAAAGVGAVNPLTINSTISQNMSAFLTRATTVTGKVEVNVTGAGNTLTIGGAIDVGANNLTLSAEGGIVLSHNLTSTGTIVLNSSGGGITTNNVGASTTKAKVTAATVTASISGAGAIYGNFATLGSFTQAANAAFAINDERNLNLTGPITVTNGTLTVNVTGSTGTAPSVVHNTLTIATAINAGAGNLTFSSAGAMVINENLTTTGDVSLTSVNGTITLAATKKITANTLSGGTAATVSLATKITNLGAFTVSNGGNFTLTNDQAFTLKGALTLNAATTGVNPPRGDVTLSTTAGGITVSRVAGAVGSITAKGLAVTSKSAAILTNLALTGAVTGTVAGEVTLAGAFTSATGLTQTANGTVTFTAALSLTNLAAITRASGVTGDIVYNVTGAGNTITLDRDYDLGSNSVTLQSETALVINKNLTTTGNIHLVSSNGGISTASGMKITANTISGYAVGAVTLNTKVTNLGAFALSGSDNFTLTNQGALTITGAVSLTDGNGTATVGAASLTITGANNGITTSTAVGAVGSIRAASLAVTTENAVVLNNLNVTGAVTGTVKGAITLDGAFGTITGLTQASNGILTLSSTSSRTFSSIVTRGSGVTGAVIMNVTGAGNILTIGGAISTGANNLTLNGEGGIVINDNLTTTGTISLTSTGGNITTSGYGTGTAKKITADTLTGSVNGSAVLTTSINNLGDFTTIGNTHDFGLANDKDLVITGAVSVTGGVFQAKVIGALTTTGSGKITSPTFNGSASDNVNVATNITRILSFTVTTNQKSFTLRNDKSLIVENLSTTAGAVDLTTSLGYIRFERAPGAVALSAGAVTLRAATSIDYAYSLINAESISATAQGGSINLSGLNVTGAVTGTAAGAVTLTGAFDLGAFTQTASGNFVVTNSRSMVAIAPTRADGITGSYNYTVTGTGNTLTLAGDANFGSNLVNFKSDDSINLGRNVTSSGTYLGIWSVNGNITIEHAITSGVQVSLVAGGRITANTANAKVSGNYLSVTAADAVDIKTNVAELRQIEVRNGKNFKLTNDAALRVASQITAFSVSENAGAPEGSSTTRGDVTLITLAGGISIDALLNTDVIKANNLVITSAGAASLKALTLTGTLTGTVAGAVTLTNIGSVNFSGLQQTANGKFSLISNTSMTNLVAPSRAGGVTGDISYEVTGAATMSFAAPTGGATALDFGTNNVTLKSAAALTINQNITTTTTTDGTGILTLISGGGITSGNIGVTTTKAKISAGTLNIAYNGTVDVITSVSNLGSVSVNGFSLSEVKITNDKSLVLAGNINAFTLNLIVTGGITTGATNVIDIFNLKGSATSAVELRVNRMQNINAFTVSNNGNMTLSVNDRVDVLQANVLNVTGSLSVGGNLSLTTSKQDIGVGASGSITANNLTVTSAGVVNLSALNLSGTLSGKAGGAVTLSGAIGTIGTITQDKAAGSTETNFDFTVNGTSSLTLSALPTRTGGATGAINYTLTGAGSVLTVGAAGIDFKGIDANLTAQGGFALNGDVTSTGGSVTLASSGGTITQATGKRIIADKLSLSTGTGAVSLTTTIAKLGAVTIGGASNFTLDNTGGLTITRALTANGGEVYLKTSIGGITVDTANGNNGSITANSLRVISAGAATLTGLTLPSTIVGVTETGKIRGTVAGAVTLGGIFADASQLQQTANGNYLVSNAASFTINGAPNRASGVTGDISFIATGGSHAITFGSDINFGAQNVTFKSDDALVINKNITTTGEFSFISTNGGVTTSKDASSPRVPANDKKITAGTLNITYKGAVDVLTSVDKLGNITSPTSSSEHVTVTNDKSVMLAGTISVNTLNLYVTNGGITTGTTNVIDMFSFSGSATSDVSLRLNHAAFIGNVTVTNGSMTLNIDSVYASTGASAVKLTGTLSVGGTMTINTTNTGFELYKNAFLNTHGSITAKNLVINTAGAAILDNLTLGTQAAPGEVSGNVAGAITLGGRYGTFSNLQQTKDGTFTIVSGTDLTNLAQPNRATGVTGDLAYETTGTARITLANDVDFKGNNVSFKSAVALVINKNITTTGSVTLKSGAGISTASGVKITAGTLSGVANTAVTATNLAGDVSLTTSVSNLGVANGVAFSVTNGKNFTLTNDKALSIEGLVNLTGVTGGTAGNVTITITGAGNGITDKLTSPTTGINANDLTVTSAGAVNLRNLNLSGQVRGTVAGAVSIAGSFTGGYANLQQTANGMFFVTRDQTLTSISNILAATNRASGVTGGVGYYATGTNTVSVGSGDYNAGGFDLILASDVALQVNQNITNAGTVTLMSAAGITTASGKKITANTLKGQAAGNVTLSSSVTNLDDFKMTGGGNLDLTNDKALNITGRIYRPFNITGETGFGNAKFTVTNGGITTSDTGFIRASTLIGSATDNVTLKGNINYIGEFKATNKNFTMTNASAVELRGALDVGTGTVTLNTPGVTFGTNNVTGIGSIAAGNLALATTGATTIRSVTLGAGGKITGTVAGAISLVDVTADVSQLQQTANGTFSVVRSTGNITSLSFPNRKAGVTGEISFEASGASNTITLDKDYDFVGNDVTLKSNAAISIGYKISTTGTLNLISTGGGISTAGFGTANANNARITAGTLIGSAAGTVTLQTNVDNLGKFTVTGVATDGFYITNAKAFNITDVVSNSAGVVGISAVVGAINTTGSGKITADIFGFGASANSTLNTNVNKIFSVDMYGTDLTINNAKSLRIELKNGVGGFTNIAKFTLNATDATDKNLTIDAGISAKNVVLTNWGEISTSGAGAISGDSLSGNASGNVSITTAVNKLAGFTVANNKNFALRNSSKSLEITGAVSTGTGDISLLLNTSGALAINAALTGGDVSLTASGTGGAISQTAAITASGTLTARTTGAIALDGVATNAITTLGAISGYGIAIKNTKALTLMDNITSYGAGNTITINNSYGATAADKNVTLGANIVINGGDIMIDLGGGTKAETHVNNNGGTFAAGNFTLKTFTGAVNTVAGSNLTILADAITYGTAAIAIDTGTGKLNSYAGYANYAATNGIVVLGNTYTIGGVSYGAGVAYQNALVGAGFDAAKTHGTDNTISKPGLTGDVSVDADIYVNTGTTTDFSTITSTTGRVFFVGNYSDTTGLVVNAKKGISIGSKITAGTVDAAGSITAISNLSLTTSAGGINETANGVIIGGNLTINAVGGVNLTGANKINILGNMSNSGGGNITINYASTASISAGQAATWSNKSGMIILKTPYGNFVMNNTLTIDSATTALRLDLGSKTLAGGVVDGGNLIGSATATINAKGVDVYFSGHTSGHSVKFNLGATAAVGNTPAVAGGTFTHVADATPKTGSSETIDKAYTVPVAASFLGLGATSGITVVNNDGTTPSSQPAVGKGLRFRTTDAVTIDGNWGAATATNNGSLRWIEGGTINVKPNASFAGSIVLAATGSAATPTVAGNATTNDIFANLYVAGNLTAAKDVILLQTGNVTPPALLASGKTASNAPGADAYGIYVGGAVTATSGSVIMAQTGAVTANSGSAWGIKANNIIYGKIGVDIYNGGAVTAAQTLSNLSVSAYGVQLIGAVWTGGNLAANSVGINNNGDVKANILSDATAYGSTAASVFTTSATNSADATINANAAAEAVRALNAAIAGTAAGSKPSISITVSGTATTYDLSTTLGYNNAYAASVTKYKNENASLRTNLINSNKATLLFAGKAVSATGVSTGNVTSGSVSIGNNANVTDNVDASGTAITSSKIPTVSSTGLALGVLTASQGRVVVSHAGAVSGITSATGINLVAATGIGVAQVTRPAASPLGNIAAVTGGVSMSASGDVSATAATSTAKGINVLGAVTATLGKVDISQDGAVSGGVLASGITLAGVTSIGSIQTSSGAANALTTNHAVAGGIEIRQNGSVTGNDANGILVYGAITGVNAAVTVKTGVAAIGDETATSPAKIVLAKTGKAYGMNLLGAVTTVGHASNVVASITIGQYATVTADNSSATGLNTGVVILANGTTSSTVNLSNSGNVTANQSKANRSVSATGISTTYVYGGNLSGNSVTITNNGVVKANNVSDATADSYVTDIGVRNWADANAVSSFNLAAQTAANKAISANATSIMIGSTTYNLGTTALNNIANAAYVTQYKTDNANDLVVLKRNNAAQYILNGAVVTAAGVNTGTVIAGGNLKIENKNTVSHGVNETAVNYVVTATGLNLLGAMNANAGVVTLNQTAAVTGITGATGINLVAATGIGVAQVTRPAASPLGNIAAVTGGVLMSASGDVTATSSTSTAKGINVIAAVTAVNGTVKISQDGAVSGGVLASGITLVGVTSIGAIQISSGPANALTKNHAVAGGIEIRQNGTVTGNNGDANGIVSYGGITGVNGTVTVKTGVDTIGAITASATAKTIKAKTGKAFGMNLLGAVTTVGHAGNVDASITIGQYATVTADKGSATGLNTGVVILANGTTSSTVNLSNNGDVTANQSKANRSVSATGISTAYVYGGNLATNTVTITNNGLVTAKNVSDSEADSYVTDIGVRNWADANAVNSINLAANLAADKAINDAIAANQTAISFGTNTNVSISTVAAKTSARTAYITWYKDSRATELTNLKRSNAAQYILNGAVVTATGVNTGTVIAGGNLKIENKNTVSHGVNETAVNYVVTATGLNLLGAMNANAGVVTLNQTAAVTGITGATGINLVAATGIGVAQVTRPAASPLGNIAAVTGGVLMSASGDVTATSSTSTAKGINVIAAVTAVNGTVKISQDGAVSGGVLASGITLVGVTSIGAVETSFGPANALTKNHAVAGGIEIRQNGTVTGNNGDANGIVSYGGITGINGTVTVKTGVAAIGDETATSPAKTVLAKSGKAYGMNLLGAVTTVGYASNVVASITVAQNATVTSEKGSATGLNTGVVILANGTTTSKVDLSNNGDVTATQSKYYLPASATGVASVYVYGGNMSGNHVNITNNGVVTAKDAIANTAKSDAANKFNTQATNAAHAAVNVIPQGASAKINIGGTDYPLTNNRDAEAAKTAYIANYLATNSDVLSYVATRKTAIALVSAVVTAAGVNTGTVIAGGNLTIENKNKVWHGTNDTDVNYVVTATGLNLLGSMIANAGVVTLNQNAAVSGITGATGINLVAATGIGVAQVTRPAGSPLGNIAAVTGGVLMSASGDVTATSSTSTAKGINLIAAVTAVNGTVKISQDGAVSGGVLASGITLVGVTSIGAIQTSSGPANALTTNHAVAGGIEIRQNGDVTGNAGNAGDANGIVSYGGITGINGTVTVKTAVDSTGASTTKTIKAKVGKAFGINLVGQVTTVGHASNVVASIIVAQNAAVTADVNSATGLNTGVVILANGTSSSAVNLSNNGAVNATQSKANRSVSATGVASVYVYGGNISGNSVTIQNTKSVTANNVAATGAITAVDLLNGVVSATGIRAGTVIAGGNLTIENTSTGAVSHGSVDAAPNYLVSATGINVTGALIATLGQVSVKQGGAVTGVTSATGISMISATGSGIAGVSYTTQIGNGVATSTAVTSAVTSAISISGNGNVSASGATSTAKGIVVLGNLIGTQGAVSVTLGTSTTTGTVSGGASATGISVVNVNAAGSATKIETKVVTAPAPSSTTTTTVTTTTALAGDITITQKGDVSVSAVSAGSATGVVGNALTAALGSVSVTAGAVTGVSSATTGVGNTATGINLTGVATATNANAVNGTTITAGNTKTTTNLSAVTGSIVSLSQTGDVIVNGSGTVGEAKAIVTSVLSGASGVSVVQNGAVTGKSDAYGILVNGAILSNSGVVRVKSGVSLITDTTVPATAKIITAKNGKAYGIKLADVNTARAVGVTADGSITVGQYATVTADKSSATGVTLANVILANGTANSTINLSNNGAVTAKQSVANPLVTAIGVAVNGAVVGGNMAGNNVTITNAGVVAAKTSADVIVPTSSFDIKAVASITANTVGNTLSLNAIGNIDATGAVIIAKTVTASSGTAVNVGGKVSLNNGGNQIANFGAITAGSFDIGSAIDFNLTGDLTKTSTVASDPMKLSNYKNGLGITVAAGGISAKRASGNLAISFKGTGKFAAAGGSITYVNTAVNPNTSTVLTSTDLSNKASSVNSAGVTITSN